MNCEKSVSKIQKEILNIYSEYKRICEKYELRYYAIGGTCIGAVRHQGFIPWDDDLDVAMPYDDYLKFIDIASSELQDPFSLYLPSEHKPYKYNFIKLQNKNTTLIETKCTPFPDRYTGIYIDIMPLYGLPSGKDNQVKYQNLCDRWLRANRTIRFPLRYDDSVLSKLFWILHLPVRLTKPFSYYTDKLHDLFRNIAFDESDKILFGWRRKPSKRYPLITYKSMFEFVDFSDALQVPFEDTTIYIPVGYDNYLKADFGNYMVLPPVEQRVPGHPVDVLDFDKSFKDYQTAFLEGEVTWL